MRSYAASVSFKTLFALLVAVAVLFAPAITREGEAMAAVPDHHAQMMDSGHCKSPPSKSDHHGKSDGKSCCISMCMGVAVAPATPMTETVQQVAPTTFTVATIHLPYLGELATPPPRIA
jgi:hypothetical protein